MTLPIFIGYDEREAIAFDVCRHSLLQRSSVPLYITGLYQDRLREIGIYRRQWEWRDGQRIDMIDEKPFSTQFSFTRFLVPALCQYTGWALFVDCDFLFLADIAELLAHADKSKAVLVCQQQHSPIESVKMDGCRQEPYRRKNWSSLMLFNCGHPSNRRLTVDVVNSAPGSHLHQFGWLEDAEIGALPEQWNFIEGVTIGHPKAVHYTTGGPWMYGHQSVAFASEWKAEYAAACRKAIQEIAA